MSMWTANLKCPGGQGLSRWHSQKPRRGWGRSGQHVGVSKGLVRGKKRTTQGASILRFVRPSCAEPLPWGSWQPCQGAVLDPVHRRGLRPRGLARLSETLAAELGLTRLPQGPALPAPGAAQHFLGGLWWPHPGPQGPQGPPRLPSCVCSLTPGRPQPVPFLLIFISKVFKGTCFLPLRKHFPRACFGLSFGWSLETAGSRSQTDPETEMPTACHPKGSHL